MIQALHHPKPKDRWVMVAIGYSCIVLLIGAYQNYTTPYDLDPTTRPTLSHWFTWIGLYVPLFVFPLWAKWDVHKIGFLVNPLSIVISSLSAAIAVVFGLMLQFRTVSWGEATIEAFARSGEEIFFRGFLFILFVEIFHKKRRPWIWAAMISSVLFALVHTQIFQPAYYSTHGSGPVAYIIIERLLNVFLFGLGFSILRHWTKSILPGSIIHGLLNAGSLTLPFTIVIHAAIVLWARSRNEEVFSG
jgi:membrane protease YdiL (CAAX protease family)